MPIKLKRIFEREYESKGKTKAQADRIFYGFEAKHNPLFHHPNMSREWKEQEKRESHSTPFTPKWFEKEKREGHPSIHLNNVDWSKWKLEESKENIHIKSR